MFIKIDRNWTRTSYLLFIIHSCALCFCILTPNHSSLVSYFLVPVIIRTISPIIHILEIRNSSYIVPSFNVCAYILHLLNSNYPPPESISSYLVLLSYIRALCPLLIKSLIFSLREAFPRTSFYHLISVFI